MTVMSLVSVSGAARYLSNACHSETRVDVVFFFSWFAELCSMKRDVVSVV